MSTRSFTAETTDLGVVREALSYHLQEIVSSLHEHHALATSIRILAYPSRFGDYALQGVSVEERLTVPSNDIFVLGEIVEALVQRSVRPQVPYKKAGIVVLVTPAAAVSLPLFPTSNANPATQAITETLLRINEEQGRGALRLGTTVKTVRPWAARIDNVSPNYTTSWQSLRVVKASE